MMTLLKVSLAGFLALGFVACANGPCVHMRQPQLAERAGAPSAASAAVPGGNVNASSTTSSAPIANDTTVLVAKEDGSLQCGSKGMSAEEMEKQLKGIKVLSRDKRPDGKMHIQVCGSPTGNVNVYEIPISSLSEAESRGFKKL